MNRTPALRLMATNADGSAPTRLTPTSAGVRGAKFSPNGKQILFEQIVFPPGQWDLFVMNTDGSGVLNLTSNPADDVFGTWSPDGKHIAFQSNRDGVNEIYIMNADGSDQTRLTELNESLGPVFAWLNGSPGGKPIAFAADEQQRMDPSWTR